MNEAVLPSPATAVGALIGFFGQEFHLWRQHRRRFDEARQVAHTNLVSEAFRTDNEFAGTWSPFTILCGRRKYLDLQNDVTRVIATARLVASQPVYEAAGELMDAVSGIVSFATSILVKDAKFGMLAGTCSTTSRCRWLSIQACMNPRTTGQATTRFIVAAQKEINVPGKRQVAASA